MSDEAGVGAKWLEHDSEAVRDAVQWLRSASGKVDAVVVGVAVDKMPVLHICSRGAEGLEVAAMLGEGLAQKSRDALFNHLRDQAERHGFKLVKLDEEGK